MEFDDSAEKLRRNLIVFSFGYLVSAYLGVSLLDAIDAAGLSKVLGKVSPLRLTIVLIIVFIYFSFRWFTSQQHSKLSEKFLSTWSSNYQFRRSNFVERHVTKWPSHPPNWISFSSDDLATIDAWYVEAEKAKTQQFTVNCWAFAVSRQANPDGNTMKLYLYKNNSSSCELNIEYKFKTPIFASIGFHAAIAWGAIKGEEIYELIPPILLALMADYLLFYRLGGEFLK